MGRTARKTDPALWDRVKDEVTQSGKGGRVGQWSARKAQLAVQEYKRRGGGYVGERSEDNALRQWTKEDWGTASGRRSRDTGERYLPEQAREALSDEDYARTTKKKRADARAGRQFSGQPPDIQAKTAPYRRGGNPSSGGAPTKAELYDEARRRDIRGRSKMSKQQLIDALDRQDREDAT